MIVHRMATQAPPPPPVRFYKVIALSFLFLTVVLLGVVIFVTSKKATIVILAKQDKETVSLISALNGTGTNSLAGSVTSTQFAWSEKYKPTGNKKIEGAAKGEVVLYNKTNAAQPLVKTTRLLSPTGVLFRLSSGTVVPANGQVKVAVYADKQGPSSEIGPTEFTIPGLTAEKQKVIYGKSSEPMTGGLVTVGIISEEDLQNAKADYEQKVKTAFLYSLGEDKEGVERIVSVETGNVVSDKKAGEEVSEFTISGNNTVLVVEYKAEDLKNLINREINSKINTETEKVVSLTSKPVVSVQSYDLNAVTASLNVRQEVAATLDANIPGLAPENFYGKKKEEIERYILGLDHVSNVDVKFSPSWIFTAPSVPDKISVVVKSVR